jgi:hypothetical protein
MDIGCHLPNQGPLANGEALTRFAREADQRGIASLWVSDHVIFPRNATGSYHRRDQDPEPLPAARSAPSGKLSSETYQLTRCNTRRAGAYFPL